MTTSVSYTHLDVYKRQMWERLRDIAVRPQHIVDGSAVTASQPDGKRDGWRHRGFTLTSAAVAP